jgi:cytochrome c5
MSRGVREVAGAAGVSGLALLVGLGAVSASAGEPAIKLAADPHATLVESRCSTCHSLDYLVMNSPFLPRAGWEAEVRKMIKVMGAPIPEGDVAPIVDYLTQNYGND